MPIKFTIYGNATTRVAHRRGKAGDACYQHALKPRNVERFQTFASAEKNGYRACKRCKPDK